MAGVVRPRRDSTTPRWRPPAPPLLIQGGEPLTSSNAVDLCRDVLVSKAIFVANGGVSAETPMSALRRWCEVR